MRICPKGVTPECFNRGSSSGLAWIPDGSRTSPSRGKSRDKSIREWRTRNSLSPSCCESDPLKLKLRKNHISCLFAEAILVVFHDLLSQLTHIQVLMLLGTPARLSLDFFPFLLDPSISFYP